MLNVGLNLFAALSQFCSLTGEGPIDIPLRKDGWT